MNFKNKLIISYFDTLMGPRIFYFDDFFVNGGPPQIENVLNIYDIKIREEEPFLFYFKNHFMLNHIFFVDSKYQSRGWKEHLMVTFMGQDSEPDKNNFNYQKKILVEFAEKLKKLPYLPEILKLRCLDYSNGNKTSVDEFKTRFLEIYNKYYSILLIKNGQKAFKSVKSEKIKMQCPFCNSISYLSIPNKIINQARNIDVYLMKLNLSPKEIATIIHFLIFEDDLAILLYGKSIEVIKNLDLFLKFIFRNSFQINFKLIPENDFCYQDKHEHPILDLSEQILSKDGFLLEINDETSKFEREIVKKFYENSDSIRCLLNIRDKIYQVYLISKKISDYLMLRRPDYDNPLSEKELTNYLGETQYVQVSRSLMKFLVEIIQRKDEIKIVWLKDAIARQIEIMWGYQSSN